MFTRIVGSSSVLSPPTSVPASLGVKLFSDAAIKVPSSALEALCLPGVEETVEGTLNDDWVIVDADSDDKSLLVAGV